MCGRRAGRRWPCWRSGPSSSSFWLASSRRITGQPAQLDVPRVAQALQTSPPSSSAGSLPDPKVSECTSLSAPDAQGTPIAHGGRPHPRETDEPAQDGPIVVDTTGLIDRCEVWYAEAGDDGFFVTNPGSDEEILEVLWSGSECDRGSTFRFSSLQDRFQLVSQPPHPGCAEPVTRHSVRLFLSSPVLAASVSADFPMGLAPMPTTLSQD